MLFIKDVVTPGTYSIPQPDGSRRKVDVTPERLRKWSNNFSRQRSKGLNIPAPAYHDFKDAIPVKVGSDGIVKSSKDNLGFWEELWFDEETQKLKGVINAPGDPNDPKTPAGMMGKTVKETSIYIKTDGEWEDGSGDKWNEPVMHIACCLHPIERGQANFVPVTDDIVLAMSFREEEGQGNSNAKPKESKEGKPGESSGEGSGDPAPKSNSGANINLGEVIELLRTAAKIAVPKDSTEDNFIERLLVALQQKALEDEEGSGMGGTVKKPPEGAQPKGAPLVMASLTQAQLDVLAKVNNPVTGKPFTAEDFKDSLPTEDVIMSHPKVKELVSATTAVTTALNDTAKKNYHTRIQSLVSSGRIGKEYADKVLTPMVEAIVMSFGADGKPQQQPLDITLNALEAAPPLIQNQGSVDYEAGLAMSMGGSGGGLPPGHSIPQGYPHTPPAQGDDPAAVNAALDRLRKIGLLH